MDSLFAELQALHERQMKDFERAVSLCARAAEQLTAALDRIKALELENLSLKERLSNESAANTTRLRITDFYPETL